jgi:hypothetical protein
MPKVGYPQSGSTKKPFETIQIHLETRMTYLALVTALMFSDLSHLVDYQGFPMEIARKLYQIQQDMAEQLIEVNESELREFFSEYSDTSRATKKAN